MEHLHRVNLARQLDPKHKAAARQGSARALREVTGNDAARRIQIGGIATPQLTQMVIITAAGEEFGQRFAQQF